MDTVMVAVLSYRMDYDYDGTYEYEVLGNYVLENERDFSEIVGEIEKCFPSGTNLRYEDYSSPSGDVGWTSELSFRLRDDHRNLSVGVELRYCVEIGKRLFELTEFKID